ncbi:Ribosomal protein S4 [Rhynchospora pubera]|uniref:Ribosomal protein S4 n=1 Tax=Rhynchospora pubera TaxID=906938 RepID=A0AAV8AP06_9POAL|nr:Ribosomal protein S4 [Rhynchospora pubera]
MSRYRGPRFKKIRRLRTLPGLIQKKNINSNLILKKNQLLLVKKKTIWYSLRRKTEITFSLWFDRTTISSIYAYRWKKARDPQVKFCYNYLKCVWIISFLDWVWLQLFLELGNW